MERLRPGCNPIAGTLASSFANGQTVDGVTLATGNRILIKNQVSASENGIWVVNVSGAPTRATDFDTGAEIVAAPVAVEEGTLNKYSIWECVAPKATVIGSGAIFFLRITSPVVLEIAASDSADVVKYRAWAVCSGTNDEQTINFALGNVALMGGGRVRLASRTYNIDVGGVVTVPTNCALIGDTQGASTLLYRATGGNCVTILGADSGSSRSLTCVVSDLQFQAENGSNAVALFMQNAAFLHLDRLQFDGFAGHAIRAVTVQDSEFRGCILRNCGSTDGSLRAALRIESTAVDPPSNNLSFFWCDFETNVERDIDTIPSGQLQNALRFIACKFESTQIKNGAAADVNARILLDRVNNADFNGCFFYYGDLSSSVRGRAVVLANNSATAIAFRGCYFNTGGTGTPSFKAWIELAGVLSATLIGNTIVYGSVTQQPSVAAFVFSGTSAKVFRSGNVVAFALGGSPVLESGTFTGRFSNSGTATITGAATSVVVNHGLHVAPTLGGINVTPTTTWFNATKWWITNPTATQFTINSTAPGGANAITFAWGARVPSTD